MKLKVCGMKFENNISEINNLNPDFMGFIFWPKSKRFFNEKKILLPNNIKKVGVFVNQSYDLIIDKVNKYNLDYVQLHGDEDFTFCKMIKSHCKVIKVFSIGTEFDFGNGIKFDWKILNKYNSKKPFLLSGGIDVNDFEDILNLKELKIPILGIDINSKFETKPGLKDYKKIKELIKKMKK